MSVSVTAYVPSAGPTSDNQTLMCDELDGDNKTRCRWGPGGSSISLDGNATIQDSNGTAPTSAAVKTNLATKVDQGSMTTGKWCKANGSAVDCTEDTPAGGSSSWVVKTEAYTAVAGDKILADTTAAAFSVALPATPDAGDEVDIADANGTFNTYNLTVVGNGANIAGGGDNATLSVNNSLSRFIYFNANKGWLIF